MAYQALYRQWRPQDFSHMVSQQAVIETLRNQIMSGRIAHAYLFCGSRGTGKTSTAKIMAKAVNCESPVNGDPCGHCSNCIRLQEESLDVVEIDAASNNGVDEMRDLRETVKYPPQYGRFKVYIIDEVHMLSTSAFNALLKTLQEPPAHVVFILATTEPQKLPATILSRCQRFDFGRIPVSQIMHRLREAAEGAGGQVSDGALMTIARAAEGGMRDALSILDMCLGYNQNVNENLVRDILGTSDRSFLFEFADALLNQNSSMVLKMIDRLIRKGREPGVFAKDISQHFRTLLAAKCCKEDMEKLMDLTFEDCQAYINQAEEVTVSRLMQIMELYMKLENETRYVSSPRIALETFSLKACLKSHEVDVQSLTDRIFELEKIIKQLNEKVQNGSYYLPVQKSDDHQQNVEVSSYKRDINPHILTKNDPNETISQNEVWKKTLEILKKTGPSMYPMLTGFGSFSGSEGNIFKWTAKPENDIFARSIGQEKNKQIIEAALKEATGHDCQFIIITGQDNSYNSNEEDHYVESLKSTFGGTSVVIRE